jgi:hypothetical protein
MNKPYTEFTMKSFNERIDFIMLKLGSPFLSEKTGISRTQLHRLKQEGNETTRPNLIKVSETFGCNLLWLITGEGPIMAGDPDLLPPLPPEFTNDEIEMIELFRVVSLKKKSEILNQLMNND